MRQGTVRTVSVLVVLCLALAAAGGVAAADDAGTAAVAEHGVQGQNTTTESTADNSSTGTAAPPAQTNTITVEQEYRLTPDQPGRVDVRWEFTLPENVVEIRTQLPSDGTFVSRNGFERTSDGYVWDEDQQSTRTPTLTYTTAVNETDEVSGPIGSDGKYLFVDAGDWALIERERGPQFGISYTGDSEPTVTRTNTTAGPGVTGQSMVFLGEHREYTQSAHDQQFRLVVPEAATLSPSRAEVFETVTDASATLRVGDRDRRVSMFVAPETVPWAVRGLQTGDRDFYAVADEPVDSADNVWIHEYVHTRQDYQTASATAWTTEAFAEYYAGLLTLEQDRIAFDEFRSYLDRGTRSRFSEVVLADRSTWTGTGGNYYTGALVAGELDRRLRAATDREHTLQAVLRRMNRQSTQVRQSDFLGYVESAGGTSPREAAREYTETTDRPDPWSASEHSETFQRLPAQFTYTFPPAGDDRLRVVGPYRNRTLTAGPLVVGERLQVGVNVTNVGGTEGSYDLTVTREGSTLATRTGSALAGQSVTEPVETAFESPGTYTLATEDEEFTVRVEEAATASVTDLSVNRSSVTTGEAVRVTATVSNPASKPADGSVTIRQGTEQLRQQTVQLDAGESTQVSAVVTLSTDGTAEFTAGDQSASVSVSESSLTGGEIGPGFGVVAVLLAVAASLLVAHRIE